MKTSLSYCVFCGASSGKNKLYAQTARDIGRLFGENGWHMVYGGGHVGLMGIAADAALDSGTPVTGIIPGHLQDKEIAHDRLTDLHITKTMHERQMMMNDLSDGFIILPGGMGTLAEFFEVVTWKQLGLHNKPIVILNAGGYWHGLHHILQTAIQEGFCRPTCADLYDICDNVNAIPAILGRNLRKNT